MTRPTARSDSLDRLAPWLMLKNVTGLGNLLIRRLLDRFETPEAVFEAAESGALASARISGITARLAEMIRSANRRTDAVHRELDRLAATPYRLLTFNDPAYPALLRQVPDPPPFLYVHGDLGPCARTLAVVGSRSATQYGLTTARTLCRELTELGLEIVSGMARGVDTAAHLGALDGGGRTIAVLGSGLENVYPSENRALFRRIAESGAVVSEFSLDAAPEAFHFPVRNRIISGLSLGTVVVEAASRSGSLITARLAAEQNREVFAVPGNIHSRSSVGTHNLIKQGAKLVESVEDILEELPNLIQAKMAEDTRLKSAMMAPLPPLSDMERRVLDALEPYPVHIDDLVRKLDADAGQVSGILLQLELKGLIAQSPGMMFSLAVTVGRS